MLESLRAARATSSATRGAGHINDTLSYSVQFILHRHTARIRHEPDRQHVDTCGACRSQGARRGLDGRTGGDYIVHEEHIASLHRCTAATRHRECALHVASALIPGEPHLRRCRACAHQHPMAPGEPSAPRNLLRQQGRLIELSPHEPPTRERHRHHDVDARQQVCSGRHHPAAEEPASVVAIMILEAVHETLEDAVVTPDGNGPRAIVNGRVGCRCRRDHGRAIAAERQGKSKPVA